MWVYIKNELHIPGKTFFTKSIIQQWFLYFFSEILLSTLWLRTYKLHSLKKTIWNYGSNMKCISSGGTITKTG